MPIRAISVAILRFIDDGPMFDPKSDMHVAFTRTPKGPQPWHQLETVLN
jgi:hypothetical protein